MTISNFVFGNAKGRWVEKSLLPLGTDNLLIVLFQSSGLQVDATLQTYSTLAQITGAGNTEAGFTNYSRLVISGSGISVTFPSNTSASVALLSNPVWNAAGGASNNTLGKLLVCYRPTSSSLDSAILPLTAHDFSCTTTGGNLTATMSTIATAT